MLDYLHMRLIHVRDALRTGGIKPLLREIVYRDRIAVVVGKDLKDVPPNVHLPRDHSGVCAEITPAMLDDAAIFNQYRNRELKAAHYLKKGFRGFGLFVGQEIVADLWYYRPSPGAGAAIPKDLEWLGLECPMNSVYSFDMFLNPKLRGQNLAAFFQSSFLRHLRDLNVERAYGYYWQDNLPALWVHRMLKWEEIKTLRVSRVLAYRKTKAPKTSCRIRPKSSDQRGA
jgi:hypothetical protein